MELQRLLEQSARSHSHLCPRQILGVRLGLAGMKALGFDAPPPKKRLFVIVETDGCFVDGLMAAADCTVGHRTLRVEDYGKTAAVFVDTHIGQAVRVAPRPDIRQKALACAVDERRSYFAQMQAYQVMPAEAMFTIAPVRLRTSIEALLSRPGQRVNCSLCGEEIMNQREIWREGQAFCRFCAGDGYYQVSLVSSAPVVLTLPQPLAGPQ